MPLWDILFTVQCFHDLSRVSKKVENFHPSGVLSSTQALVFGRTATALLSVSRIVTPDSGSCSSDADAGASYPVALID